VTAASWVLSAVFVAGIIVGWWFTAKQLARDVEWWRRQRSCPRCHGTGNEDTGGDMSPLVCDRCRGTGIRTDGP
jgi:hypothetical protein